MLETSSSPEQVVALNRLYEYQLNGYGLDIDVKAICNGVTTTNYDQLFNKQDIIGYWVRELQRQIKNPNSKTAIHPKVTSERLEAIKKIFLSTPRLSRSQRNEIESHFDDIKRNIDDLHEHFGEVDSIASVNLDSYGDIEVEYKQLETPAPQAEANISVTNAENNNQPDVIQAPKFDPDQFIPPYKIDLETNVFFHGAEESEREQKERETRAKYDRFLDKINIEDNSPFESQSFIRQLGTWYNASVRQDFKYLENATHLGLVDEFDQRNKNLDSYADAIQGAQETVQSYYNPSNIGILMRVWDRANLQAVRNVGNNELYNTFTDRQKTQLTYYYAQKLIMWEAEEAIAKIREIRDYIAVQQQNLIEKLHQDPDPLVATWQELAPEGTELNKTDLLKIYESYTDPSKGSIFASLKSYNPGGTQSKTLFELAQGQSQDKFDELKNWLEKLEKNCADSTLKRTIKVHISNLDKTKIEMAKYATGRRFENDQPTKEQLAYKDYNDFLDNIQNSEIRKIFIKYGNVGFNKFNTLISLINEEKTEREMLKNKKPYKFLSYDFYATRWVGRGIHNGFKGGIKNVANTFGIKLGVINNNQLLTQILNSLPGDTQNQLLSELSNFEYDGHDFTISDLLDPDFDFTNFKKKNTNKQFVFSPITLPELLYPSDLGTPNQEPECKPLREKIREMKHKDTPLTTIYTQLINDTGSEIEDGNYIFAIDFTPSLDPILKDKLSNTALDNITDPTELQEIITKLQAFEQQIQDILLDKQNKIKNFNDLMEDFYKSYNRSIFADFVDNGKYENSGTIVFISDLPSDTNNVNTINLVDILKKIETGIANVNTYTLEDLNLLISSLPSLKQELEDAELGRNHWIVEHNTIKARIGNDFFTDEFFNYLKSNKLTSYIDSDSLVLSYQTHLSPNFDQSTITYIRRHVEALHRLVDWHKDFKVEENKKEGLITTITERLARPETNKYGATAENPASIQELLTNPNEPVERATFWKLLQNYAIWMNTGPLTSYGGADTAELDFVTNNLKNYETLTVDELEKFDDVLSLIDRFDVYLTTAKEEFKTKINTFYNDLGVEPVNPTKKALQNLLGNDFINQTEQYLSRYINHRSANIGEIIVSPSNQKYINDFLKQYVGLSIKNRFATNDGDSQLLIDSRKEFKKALEDKNKTDVLRLDNLLGDQKKSNIKIGEFILGIVGYVITPVVVTPPPISPVGASTATVATPSPTTLMGISTPVISSVDPASGRRFPELFDNPPPEAPNKAEIKALKTQAESVLDYETRGDWHTILGVPADADVKKLKKGYISKAKEFHPDKVQSYNNAELTNLYKQAFQAIQKAHNALSDGDQKAFYTPQNPQPGIPYVVPDMRIFDPNSFTNLKNSYNEGLVKFNANYPGIDNKLFALQQMLANPQMYNVFEYDYQDLNEYKLEINKIFQDLKWDNHIITSVFGESIPNKIIKWLFNPDKDARIAKWNANDGFLEEIYVLLKIVKPEILDQIRFIIEADNATRLLHELSVFDEVGSIYSDPAIRQQRDVIKQTTTEQTKKDKLLENANQNILNSFKADFATIKANFKKDLSSSDASIQQPYALLHFIIHNQLLSDSYIKNRLTHAESLNSDKLKKLRDDIVKGITNIFSTSKTYTITEPEKELIASTLIKLGSTPQFVILEQVVKSILITGSEYDSLKPPAAPVLPTAIATPAQLTTPEPAPKQPYQRLPNDISLLSESEKEQDYTIKTFKPSNEKDKLRTIKERNFGVRVGTIEFVDIRFDIYRKGNGTFYFKNRDTDKKIGEDYTPKKTTETKIIKAGNSTVKISYILNAGLGNNVGLRIECTEYKADNIMYVQREYHNYVSGNDKTNGLFLPLDRFPENPRLLSCGYSVDNGNYYSPILKENKIYIYCQIPKFHVQNDYSYFRYYDTLADPPDSGLLKQKLSDTPIGQPYIKSYPIRDKADYCTLNIVQKVGVEANPNYYTMVVICKKSEADEVEKNIREAIEFDTTKVIGVDANKKTVYGRDKFDGNSEAFRTAVETAIAQSTSLPVVVATPTTPPR